MEEVMEDEEVQGEYVQSGDVMEWHWAEGKEPGIPANTGGWIGPEGEFDPTSAPELEVSPAERPQEDVSPGFVLVEPAEAEEEIEEEDDLESYTKEELQEMLADRGLPTSGNKPELIERLAE